MATLTPSRLNQPYPLPITNRKLRNLLSLSLRNLSLDPTPTTPSTRRSRGKTIVDDDAVPHSLKSPAKIVALREQAGKLEYSRSSSDLRRVSEDAIIGAATEDGEGWVLRNDGSPAKAKTRLAETPTRPKIGRMRRRSTLEWVNATPQLRQEKLERVTEERMMDVFFSLHVEGVEEPIYVSETVLRTMNPTFRHVDFSACGPGVMRLERVEVRVWVRRVGKEEGGWRGLGGWEVDLRRVLFLGKSLDTLTHPLPPNALILHLKDGIYTPLSTSLDTFTPPPRYPLTPGPPVRSGSSRILPSSSFDALLRLAKLDDSIQDALTVRNKLAADLESLLQKNREPLEARDRVKEAQDRLKTIEYAQSTVSKQVEKAKKQAEEKRASLVRKRELMLEDLGRRKREKAGLQTCLTSSLIPSLHETLEAHRRAIQAQRRRICEDIQKIYPILPIPKESLTFTIRGLRLPNIPGDVDDNVPPDEIAAALGHTAHVIQLLSFYLGQALLYAVTVRGSSSTVLDGISLLKTNPAARANEQSSLRTYPLYLRGVPRFRFDYALFLLNKDIQLLLETLTHSHGHGIGTGRVPLDVRQTLPNLKYLFYVVTAGQGDDGLPPRLKGGVKGLVKAKEEGMDGGAVKGGKGGGGAVESLRRNIGPLPRSKG